MATDTEIKIKGVQVLREFLGSVEAERFIALMLKEPFDYTEWQSRLFPDMSVETISRAAMEARRAKNG